MQNFYQNSFFSADYATILFFIYAKNTLNGDAQCADVNRPIGGRKHHACVIIGNVAATAIFDHLFIKSNISAMDRLFVVKFYTNIANR